jgi:hypothetical protein
MGWDQCSVSEGYSSSQDLSGPQLAEGVDDWCAEGASKVCHRVYVIRPVTALIFGQYSLDFGPCEQSL